MGFGGSRPLDQLRMWGTVLIRLDRLKLDFIFTDRI